MVVNYRDPLYYRMLLLLYIESLDQSAKSNFLNIHIKYHTYSVNL